MTSVNPHDRKFTKPADDDDMDPVEKHLSKVGCLNLHYAVQECMFDNKDWRKCQEQVHEFRKCIENSKKQNQ